MDAEALIRNLASQQTRDELDAKPDNSLFPRRSREIEMSLDSCVLDYFIRQARKVRDGQ